MLRLNASRHNPGEIIPPFAEGGGKTGRNYATGLARRQPDDHKMSRPVGCLRSVAGREM